MGRGYNPLPFFIEIRKTSLLPHYHLVKIAFRGAGDF